MSKKNPTPEEKIIAEAADLIMQTIHIASVRIAEKYERMLMDEVVTRINCHIEASDTVDAGTADFLNNKLKKLTQ